MGFYTPTGGEITIDGEPLTAANRRRWQNAVGYVSQHVFLLDGTLLENIALGEEEEKIDRRRAEESLRAARLEDFVQSLSAGIDTPIGEAGNKLSGGQRQRIGIARAIALQPDLIVCDEPVSALDVSVQSQVLNLLKDLQKQYGLTYLFIGHDLSVINFIADRVCVMFLGHVCEVATKEELYSRPMHPYTAFLMDAIPQADPHRRNQHRRVLMGEVPSPVNLPSGCCFHTRCPYATERCRTEVPELREWDGRMVACHRAGENWD